MDHKPRNLREYLGTLYETWLYSGPLGYALVVIWLLYPVAIATIFIPLMLSDFRPGCRGWTSRVTSATRRLALAWSRL